VTNTSKMRGKREIKNVIQIEGREKEKKDKWKRSR
jgi:hypothetical protein